jgi:hypothetical protein
VKKTIIVLIVIGLFAGPSYASDKDDVKVPVEIAAMYEASPEKEKAIYTKGPSDYAGGNIAAYGNPVGEGWE